MNQLNPSALSTPTGAIHFTQSFVKTKLRAEPTGAGDRRTFCTRPFAGVTLENNFMKRTVTTGAMAMLLAGAMLAQGQFGPGTANGTAPDPATIIANQVARLTT